jgi:hypothetical protein
MRVRFAGYKNGFLGLDDEGQTRHGLKSVYVPVTFMCSPPLLEMFLYASGHWPYMTPRSSR